MVAYGRYCFFFEYTESYRWEESIEDTYCFHAYDEPYCGEQFFGVGKKPVLCQSECVDQGLRTSVPEPPSVPDPDSGCQLR